MFQDPELLRQFVHDRHESLIAEATNQRLLRSAPNNSTHAGFVITTVMKGLLSGVVTVSVAMAIFLAVTVAVQLWLATATSTGSGGYAYPVPSYAYVTPDPHP